MSNDDFGAWGHTAHVHRDDQFVLALAETATVDVHETRFAVSTELGVWIPAGVRHSARFAPGFAAFVHRTGTPTHFTAEPRAVAVDAALRQRLLASSFEDISPTKLLHDALKSARAGHDEPSEGSPLDAPPIAGLARIELEGPLTRVIAAALHADPADDRSLEGWAQRLHTSAVTIRRAFQRETGASFSAWRTAVRLEASAAMLHRGSPVATVARTVGLTHNGLLAACRRHYGCTPSELRARQQASSRGRIRKIVR